MCFPTIYPTVCMSMPLSVLANAIGQSCTHFHLSLPLLLCFSPHYSSSFSLFPFDPPLRHKTEPIGSQTHHFLSKLFSQQLVLHTLLLHLQTLLVVVDRQLLQGLEDFLYLGLSRFILCLQSAELRLHLLTVTPGWCQKLRDTEI